LPVIVIGNRSIGGNGKTPITIWLAKYLHDKHKVKIGIVSSGYNSNAKVPTLVNKDSTTNDVGDEAIELYKCLSKFATIISGGNRVAATKILDHQNNCEVIIHDDGLQHYHLYSNLVIETNSKDYSKVMNLILPSGPFRDFYNGSFLEMNQDRINVSFNIDSKKRSEYFFKYDFTLWNSYTDKKLSLNDLNTNKVNLLTTIADSKNIIKFLEQNNFYVLHSKFPDHYRYTLEDIQFDNDNPVITTMKDYVKLSELSDNQYYVLSNNIIPNQKFIDLLKTKIEKVIK
tara:strand:- start:14622 stop:15479 length:858 start_codon:yes stop_codon:yes gene_type:complete